MRLLLLSNSTNYGGGYLDHAASAVQALFQGVRRIAFVPFALHDQEGYWRKARDRFRGLGIEVDRVEEGAAGRALVEKAEGLFIGGGNTFRLLDRLQRSKMVEAIAARTRAGMPYLGASAGTVVTSPTIRTTNDMPIVQPASLDALGLVPFQINCHYLDADPASRHMGETRETRLREFHEENAAPVVALREGAWIEVGARAAGAAGGAAGRRCTLGGTAGARIFVRGEAGAERAPGSDLGDLAFP